MIEDPGGSGIVEATITVNGVQLTFGESMTLRVALGSFLMFVSDPKSAAALGDGLADAYRRQLESICRILHDPLIAEHELRRQERGMKRKDPRCGTLPIRSTKMPLTVHGLPVQLFVEMRDKGDGDGPFPIASTDTLAFDDGVRVGVYKLVEVKIKSITHGFEPDRRGSK